MIWPHMMIAWILLVMGCAHNTGASVRQDWPKDARMAEAQISNEAQGSISFEQMPNSVIITYHLEGLQPRNTYQLVLHRNQSCKSVSPKSAEILASLRANKQGISEHTFKVESIRVSGDEAQALEGDSVVLQTMPKTGEPAIIGCSEIAPKTGEMASQ